MNLGEMNIYRGCEPVLDYQFENDGSQSPAEAVIEAIAAAAGVEPLELTPLYEYIDPDALDSLFQHHERALDADAILSFRINKWNVFVCSDGRIRICDGTQPTDPQPIFGSAQSKV